MKKFVASLFAVAMLAGCSSKASSASAGASAAGSAATEYVDTYTSASMTKTTLAGDDLKSAQELLSSINSKITTKAEAEAPDYVAPENGVHAQIMSVNPDGSVGFSTIGAWAYDKDANTVTTVLTDGQNAENLAKENARGTLLVHTEAGWYLIHLKTTNVEILEYSDEAFENGEFNKDYSGASNKLSEYHLTYDVLAIEQTFVAVFE